MSQDSIRIPKSRKFSSSMDYEAMRQEGIDRTQRLSGDIWTDYNEHDPGITILENLCYALTELGYKTNLPVEDLLFGKGSEKFDPRDNAMFPAPEVLPCTPQTLLDYRKLIIDHILGVKNAWVIPLDRSELGINMNGLSQVYLQLDPSFRGEPAAVIQETQQLLTAHRNLGEDVDRIEILQSEKIAFQAEINLSSNVVAESVLAEAFFRIGEMLTPQVRFHTLEDMLESGESWENIFNCPLPKHGFIKDDDLQRSELNLIGTIHKSHLIKLLTEIEGVRSVGKFQLLLNGKPIRTEITQLSPNRFPELDMRILLPTQGYHEGYPVRFVIGELDYSLDLQTVSQTYDMLITKFKQQYERPLDLSIDPPKPLRKLDEIEQYDTIQNHFPEVYGIGDLGLPARASRERKAYARQLQGYLMVFEQLMANYQSQLVHVRKLFSTDPEVEKTYFSQDLYHLPHAEDLLGENKARFRESLDQLVEEFDPVVKRRNRFLDHLLARFGEEFLTDSFNTLNRKAGGVEAKAFEKSIIQAKIRFLQNYLSISRDRGKGYDYLDKSQDSQNVSGLKKRIALLFNFGDYRDRPLSQIAHNERVLRNKKGGKKGELGISVTFSGKNPDLLSDILANGVERNHYRLDTEKTTVFFVHPDTKEEMEVFSASSIEKCEEALDALISYLQQLNSESEGFHLVEHILLRPVSPPQLRLILAQKNQKLLETSLGGEDPTKAQSNWVEQLRKLGGEAGNYSITPIKEKGQSFEILLKGKDKKVVGRLGGFVIEESAKDHIKSLAATLKKLSAKDLEKLVEVEEESKQGALFDDDPYSSWLSLVFPAWTARFQNEKFRTLMQRIVRLHTPAHLAVQFHWIDVENMLRFEETLGRWQAEKQKPSTDGGKLDQLSYHLMLLLKHFQDPEDSWVEEELAALPETDG